MTHGSSTIPDTIYSLDTITYFVLKYESSLCPRLCHMTLLRVSGGKKSSITFFYLCTPSWSYSENGLTGCD